MRRFVSGSEQADHGMAIGNNDSDRGTGAVTAGISVEFAAYRRPRGAPRGRCGDKPLAVIRPVAATVSRAGVTRIRGFADRSRPLCGATVRTPVPPGGPGERTAAEQVRVHVAHGLPAVPAGVEDDPVAAGLDAFGGSAAWRLTAMTSSSHRSRPQPARPRRGSGLAGPPGHAWAPGG